MIATDWVRKGWGMAAVVGVMGSLAAPGTLAAQGRATPAPRADRPRQESARECQCVDGQGNRSDRCFCVMVPDASSMAGAMAFSRRAVLGVNVRQDQPARYDGQGARLYGVDEDSPAGKAGLEEGDILVRVDGRSLVDPLPERRDEDRLSQDGSLPVQRLLSVLTEHEPGDSLTIEYLRDDARRTATVVMTEPRGLLRIGGGNGARAFGSMAPMGPMEPMQPMAPMGFSFEPGAGGNFVFDGVRGAACPSHGDGDARGRVVVMNLGRSCVGGVELLEMRPELAEYFGAADGGVLVADASADNPLGLRPGDVLLAVDGRAVTGVDRALRVLSSYEGEESVALKVLRKQQTMELKGRVR